jgi:hypothetical protein
LINNKEKAIKGVESRLDRLSSQMVEATKVMCESGAGGGNTI